MSNKNNDDLKRQASENTLGLNPIIALRKKDLLASAKMVLTQAIKQPLHSVKHVAHFGIELKNVMFLATQLSMEVECKGLGQELGRYVKQRVINLRNASINCLICICHEQFFGHICLLYVLETYKHHRYLIGFPVSVVNQLFKVQAKAAPTKKRMWRSRRR